MWGSHHDRECFVLARPGMCAAACGELRSASLQPHHMDVVSMNPAWQVLEPSDPGRLTPHEVCEARKLGAAWNVVAASVRGKLHAHKEMWREDAYACDMTGHWAMVVVADGGPGSLARVGAHVACASALSSLKSRLAGFSATETEDSDLGPPLRRLKKALVGAMHDARHALLKRANECDCSLSELQTTLQLVAHSSCQDGDVMASLAVGDGQTVALLEDGTCIVLAPSYEERGCPEELFVTACLSSPRIPLEDRVAIAVVHGVESIAVMTDGLSDDFFPIERRAAELFDGEPIQDLRGPGGVPLSGLLLDVLPDPRGGQALRDWLRYERKGSHDDRTIVLLYRVGDGYVE